MQSIRFLVIWMVTSLFVAGCTFPENSLLPSLTGEDPTGGTTPTNKSSNQGPTDSASKRTVITSSIASPESDRTQEETSTFVGEKIRELRRELSRLQRNVMKNNTELQKIRSDGILSAESYQRTVAAVNSRLQTGTTPGNPVLVKRYNEALGLINRISSDISKMNKLTGRITSDSSLAAFLSENTRAAFRVAGAMDRDHQQLAILEDEVNRTVVLVERLLKELSEDIQRHTNFVATERRNLNTLSASIKSGEIMGANLTIRALDAVSSGRVNSGQRSMGSMSRTRPLVIIRFDRKDVDYEQALYSAVSRALGRDPSIKFTLVAVAPKMGGAARVTLNKNNARRRAEGVLRSLQRMGLPPQRVTLIERTEATTSPEVHLFLN